MLFRNHRGVCVTWRSGATIFSMRAYRVGKCGRSYVTIRVRGTGKREVTEYPDVRTARLDVLGFAPCVGERIARRAVCMGAGSLVKGLIYFPHGAQPRVMHVDGHEVIDEPVYLRADVFLNR
jgi:hypothetical protein